MRILLLTQYFTPEVTAASARLQSLAEGLAARGHEVEVICEIPNHPEGIVRDDYRGHAFQRRQVDGFSARYVWVKTSPEKTQRTRILFYGSYTLMATLAGAAGRPPAVVLVYTPPLPAAAAAMAVARLRRVPWVMDVRDPWPEAAVALGELTNPRVVGALERLERKLYASAAAIVTVTEPFRQGIEAKVANPEKVQIIPNGTTDAWIEAGGQEADRASLAMPDDRFVLTYAGNIGIAQGMEAVIEAAGLLDDDFQLQLVGSGPRLESVREQAAKLPPGRVVFRGVVAPELAARYLRASDASLVPLGRAPELAKFVPSKLFDCCAIGRPVVVSAAGEPARLATESDAALCIPPENAVALADAVRRLRDDNELCARLSENGRAFARNHRREDGVDRFEKILEGVVAAGRRAEHGS
ncbi:MAG: glycosyltransferase family 4 protein [Solirubrobacterales bacterium]